MVSNGLAQHNVTVFLKRHDLINVNLIYKTRLYSLQYKDAFCEQPMATNLDLDCLDFTTNLNPIQL